MNISSYIFIGLVVVLTAATIVGGCSGSEIATIPASCQEWYQSGRELGRLEGATPLKTLAQLGGISFAAGTFAGTLVTFLVLRRKKVD